MNSLISQVGGPTILIFIGVIISAIGAVWAAYDQNGTSKKLEMKNEEIITLNRKLTDSLIGGSSYCYLLPESNSPSNALVEHVGEYHLYDVNVRITDLDAIKDLSVEAHLLATSSIAIGNLVPHYSGWIQNVFPLDGAHRRFLIQISARNGNFYQELQYIRVADKWEWALRLRIHQPKDPAQNSAIVLERHSENFPLTESGLINWTADRTKSQ